MSRKITIMMVAILFGILLCDAWQLVAWIYPNAAEKEINIFLDKKYTGHETLCYWLYDVANYINKIIWCFVIYGISVYVSNRLIKFCFVLIFYLFHAIDFLHLQPEYHSDK